MTLYPFSQIAANITVRVEPSDTDLERYVRPDTSTPTTLRILSPKRSISWTVKMRRILNLLIFAFIVAITVAIFDLGLVDLAKLNSALQSIRETLLLITEIAGILLLLGLAVMLYRWVSGGSEGIIVLPFENTTTEINIDGKAISDSLIFELQNIQKIYSEKTDLGMSDFNFRRFEFIESLNTNHQLLETQVIGYLQESVNVPDLVTTLNIDEQISNNLKGVGTIGIGTSTLSLGQLLVTLRKLWPAGRRPSVITGSIQKYGHTCRLVARHEQKFVNSWAVTAEENGDLTIPKLIKELAYEIAHSQSPEITTTTAKGFMYSSEALQAFRKFTKTKDKNILEDASQNALLAAKEEFDYPRLSRVLFYLGYVNAWLYGNYDLAITLLQESFRLNNIKRERVDALTHQGAVLIQKAEKVIENDLYKLFQTQLPLYEQAISAFSEVMNIDPKNFNAYFWRGTTYYKLHTKNPTPSNEYYESAKEDLNVAYRLALSNEQRNIVQSWVLTLFPKPIRPSS